MHQVLFEIPLGERKIPIYGFGAMLFLAFVLCSWLASWRAEKNGVSRAYIHDMALWLFVGGIMGARITFMIQYHLSIWEFFQIWKGGLVFYGSLVGGLIGYGLWRGWMEGREVLKENQRRLFIWGGVGALAGGGIYLLALSTLTEKESPIDSTHLLAAVVAGAVSGFAAAYILQIHVNAPLNWKLMDIVAPSIALGLALGRIGCFLNGCCYGNVAPPHACLGNHVCVDCPTVHFPLSAPPRSEYVQKGWQTAAGFTIDTRPDDDPRTRIAAVEPGSWAESRDLRPGDRIVAFNGRPNQVLIAISEDDMKKLVSEPLGGREITKLDKGGYQVAYEGYDEVFLKDRALLGNRPTYDLFLSQLEGQWPHGENKLQLTVERAGEAKPVELAAFEPRTLGLHPTQLYETISALLILLLLSAYYPFRWHDGEVMALFLLCYSLHRFLNEMLRNDTQPVFANMTLSQNGSILIFTVGALLFLWLWRQPVKHSLEPAPL